VETAKTLAERAKRLYPDKTLAARLQTLRPYICPFEEIIPFVPEGSTVLDAGCGAGLFVALLGDLGRIPRAVGFDSNPAAIALARRAEGRLGSSVSVEFLQIDATAPWPADEYDVVSLIDVMHHVPRVSHENVLSRASECVKPGGLLIYKDMANRPTWRALCNQAHDLLLARQWIHHVPISFVEQWAASLGLRQVAEGKANRYWYAHEWRVFRRSGA
jgi:2-polyprenyl-3-methyl-5-hydroxy-6-metoxy-1,4-benzoquinol methylase